jgi:hypothetical protein
MREGKQPRPMNWKQLCMITAMLEQESPTSTATIFRTPHSNACSKISWSRGRSGIGGLPIAAGARDTTIDHVSGSCDQLSTLHVPATNSSHNAESSTLSALANIL